MSNKIKLSQLINNRNFDIFYKSFKHDKLAGNDIFDIYRNLNPSYSDNGEDRVLEYIFSIIGSKNNYFIEFGARDGISGSNTYYFEKYLNWKGLLIDFNEEFIKNNKRSIKINKEFITSKNINTIFEKYNVPETIDLLSIDIDSNDYYVWESLKYKPRVVIIETNPGIPNDYPLVIQEDKYADVNDSRFQAYFGANLHAMYLLAIKKGYELVTTIKWNAIFILKEEFHLLNMNHISKEECITNYFKPNKWWFNKVLNEINNKDSEWLIVN